MSTITTLNPPLSVCKVQGITEGTSDKYVPTPTLPNIEIDISNTLRDFRRRVRDKTVKIDLLEKKEKEQNPPAVNANLNIDVSPSEDAPSDEDQFREIQEEEPKIQDPSLKTGLFEKNHCFQEESSSHKRTEAFLNDVSAHLQTHLKNLSHEGKDRRKIPEFDIELHKCLKDMAKEKEWVLVPTDKTNSWLPCHISNYVKWTKEHLHKDKYREMEFSKLKEISGKATNMLHKFKHIMDRSEIDFIESSIHSKDIPMPRILIKTINH